MPLEHRVVQEPSQVVAVDLWEDDEDFPFGPQGAKPKRVLICPSPAPYPFLLSGHRYLFKEPPPLWAQQIWSEIVAYEIARTLDVPVPPAFAATHRGAAGVLVEFFYGYDWNPPRFVHAIERFQGLNIQVDPRHGSLRDNIRLSRAHQIPDAREWWGRTVAFDAIIGNTDRHSENWGFMISQSAAEPPTYAMAPVFDNGTSLGFLTREAEVPQMAPGPRFESFIRRGGHHFGWTRGDGLRGFAPLCAHLARVYAAAGAAMEKTIQLDDARIDHVVDWCVRFEFPVPFRRARADFAAAQLKRRRDDIAKALRVG